jgi:hypothetical protein
MYEVFGVERLEDRLLMAVNITQNGVNLVITGDADDDLITIVGTGDGEVTVFADTDSDGHADDYLGEYSGVKHIRVSLGNGDDDIRAYGVDIAGHFTIDGGNGNDRVAVSEGFFGPNDLGGNVSVDTGDGDDQVYIAGTEIDGKLTIDTGDGSDLVFVGDAFYTDGEVDVDGKTSISAGADDDVVVIGGLDDDVRLGDVVLTAGEGDDYVLFRAAYGDTTIEGRTDINLGSGDDYLSVYEGVGGGSVNFLGNFSADGDAGHDEFDIDAFFGGKFTVKDF